MKDVEKWPVVRALKAWGLARQGKRDLALGLCREVAARVPTDGNCLSALDSTFRMFGATSESAAMYSAAYKVQPNNPDIVREVYEASVREGNYLQAQQAALRLYKITLDRRYVMWAASCVLVQVNQGGNTTMLAVAVRMLEKALGSGEPSSALTKQELALLITLFRESGKPEDALEALKKYGPSSPSAVAPEHGIYMQWGERHELEANLLALAGRKEEARAAYSNLLEEEPEQWNLRVRLYDLQAGMTDAPQDFRSLVEVLSAEMARAVLQQQQHPAERTAYLAEMELLKLVSAGTNNGNSPLLPEPWWAHHQEQLGDECPPREELGGALCFAIVKFFDKFMAKFCVFQDLAPYLKLFVRGNGGCLGTQMEVGRLFLLRWYRRVKEEAGEALASLVLRKEDKEGAVHNLRRLIRASQVCRFLTHAAASREGIRTPPAEVVIHEVRGLSKHFMNTQWVNEGAEGGQREVQHGDDLVLLAVHALRDLWSICEPPQSYLLRVEGAALLEYAMSCSPYNFHLKLLAIETYSELGSFSRGLELYNGLDTKHIQVESLSWLLYPGCIRCGYYAEALERSRNVLSLHRTSAQETAEHAAEASVRGNYMQMMDMIQFQRTRMDCSLQMMLAKAHAVQMELLLHHHRFSTAQPYLQHLGMGMLPESFSLSKEELEGLSDNMDYTVCSTWDEGALEEVREERASQRRSQHISCMALYQSMFRLLRKVLMGEEADEDLQEVKLRVLPEDSVGVEGLTLSATGGFQSGIMRQGWTLLLCSLETLLEAHRAKEVDPQRMEHACAIASSIRQTITAQEYLYVDSSSRDGPLLPEWLETVSNLVRQFFSPLCLIVPALHTALDVPAGNVKGKSKGKGKGKKGAKSNGPHESMGAEAPIVAAVKNFGRAVMELLTCVQNELDQELSSKVSKQVQDQPEFVAYTDATPTPEQFLQEDSPCTDSLVISLLHEPHEGYQAVLAGIDPSLEAQVQSTAGVVIRGQAQGVRRILDCIKDKVHALEAYAS
jgi:tetratricopeptide (TPR) repeat protein